MAYNYGKQTAAQAVTRVDNSVGADWSYDYDARGNLDGKYEGNVLTYDYTFDVEGRLASVRTNNQTTTFAYDADGQRVMTTYPDGTVVYTPFPDYEVTDPPTGANVTRTTYRLAGQIVAFQSRTGTSAGVFSYPLTDHLGNVIALSDLHGNPISGSDARYDPFGAFTTTPTTNPSISNHGFTGHRHNNTGANNLGLIYMNARYYLPEVGRFISADTIVPEPEEPQSYNRYAYTRNSPVNLTDPSGHSECNRPACEGERYDPNQINWLINYHGDYDLAAQARRREKLENGLSLIIDLTPVFGDGKGLLEVFTGTDSITGDSLGNWRWSGLLLVSELRGVRHVGWLKLADLRVLRWGVKGDLHAALAAAEKTLPVLPGLFKYGSNMPSISGYQRHHLWPLALGGPQDGWAVYVRVVGENYHTAQGGIQSWLDQKLMSRTQLSLADMRTWAQQNPDELLPMLRDIYSDIGIDFPY